uniref:helix-turn-helix domain-containing protein n=1 Tax=Humibacter albus TaxID=427754 RepID=UPI000A0680C3
MFDIAILNIPATTSNVGRMSITMPNVNAGRIPEWSVADRLRKARESAGLEQVELADAAGISRGTISAAENGYRVPNRATLQMWALATGVPLGWIEQGEVWCTPRDLNPEPTD